MPEPVYSCPAPVSRTASRRPGRAALLPLVGLLASLGCVASLAAASPRDEVLRLAPEDAAFCLVFEDVRGHAHALLQSPFVQQLQGSPLGAVLRRSPEVAKLAAAEVFLQTHFQVSWAQVRDDLLGDALVFTYSPGPPGQPEQEQGLILLRARDAGLLARLLDTLNEAQKQSGDLKELSTREHQGVVYQRRVERRETTYYYLRGPLLAFSSREEVIRRVIERDRQAGEGEPFIARQLTQLGLGGSVAALWINPRAFEAHLEQKTAAARGAEAVALTTFLTYWKALDGIGLAAVLDDALRLRLAVRARPDALPPAARRFLAVAAQPSALWQRFPDTALLAVAVRLDGQALAEMVGGFLTPENRQAVRQAVERGLGAVLGKDVAREVLPALGPDAGLCITAPPIADAGWFPHVVAALRVQPGGEGVPVGSALVSALHSFATLAVLGYNRERPDALSLRTVVQDRVEVRSLVNETLFPPGLQPAFALKDDYLLLASAPGVVHRFQPPGSESTAAGEVPLLRASLRSLAAYLHERRTPLLQHLATRGTHPEAEASRRLDGVLSVLTLFDRVELTQQTAPGRVTLTLRVQPAQPLR